MLCIYRLDDTGFDTKAYVFTDYMILVRYKGLCIYRLYDTGFDTKASVFTDYMKLVSIQRLLFVQTR